jgi:hypothetical protein
MVFVAALVALACLVASARRVFFAHTATRYDLGRLVEELRGNAGALRSSRLRERLLESDSWEGDVVRALSAQDARIRVAELNEALTELDFRLGRWARVPRVCASLSSSIGFLLAALLLRRGLSDPTALSGDVADLVTSGIVGQAMAVAGFGLAGAVGCAAFQARGQRAAKACSAAADAFLERLETLDARERAAVATPASAAGSTDLHEALEIPRGSGA